MGETRKDGLRCIEKVPKYCILSKLVYFLVSMTGMLIELTIRGIEIEPHIVLL